MLIADIRHGQAGSVKRWRANLRHLPARVLAAWWIAFLLLMSTTICAAADLRIAVIYPVADEPFAAIFRQIIDGIEESAGEHIIKYPVGKNVTPAVLTSLFKQQSTDVIVALGKRGIESARALHVDVPIIVGGMLYMSDSDMKELSGVSLAPDPGLLFKRLRQLDPRMSRISVVYNPERYEWLIKLAAKAAKQQRIEFIARPAEDVRHAAYLYREFAQHSDASTDALWLLQDSSTIGDGAILSFLLEVAWKRKLCIFSSNPNHVQRGALFSLYADKRALGRSLGRLALQAKNGGIKPGLKAIKDVSIAVNLRTASHLGLQLSYEQQRQFNLVFPQR